MKMEEDKEKHTEEVEHMKQQMELDKDKHTKELQDMSVQVNTFILQSDIIHLTSSQIAVYLDFHFQLGKLREMKRAMKKTLEDCDDEKPEN